ncbi:hypothetical protein BU23DRAFT_458923 [Bimuria novae-zelandiae CBS 107.79]|uniref:Glycoprotease family protein n=1 Tax=Bimuria novae-zelandiae CBS 107.79 TaxID=1447943 RepID=A0A6A5VJZ7_9PLEO|nr:hypothetical protein BU23DRAFT_458923 [Bimuria novae-zelandiae CBS 107.79]
MDTHRSHGQEPHETALQRTTTNLAYPAPTAGGSNTESRDEHILVHFNGHFSGQFNGAFILPTNMQQQAPAESDAQIAARRAMAKRSSRSFAARITRTRSRKMEMIRTTKPGITVDTSFARHRGNVPHQVYPHDAENRSRGSIRKQGWFGLGRSDTRNKGLGIVKGMTPKPGLQSEDRDGSSKDPRTADSLTAGSKSWQEISPWDRPIPIGITVPSDSVADFSDYQETRGRSDSDATLATPSIIVTPAAAMQSVWSPDTATDYTPDRASSVYSRATHLPPWSSDIPPVPSLPAGMQNLSTQKTSSAVHPNWNSNHPARARTDTLESSDTAFEEEQDDAIRKDRIMSTATVFEEDDTPLRGTKPQTLSLDSSAIPTPRRSQGWWNVITTPFVTSRRNSAWTQNGRNGEKTPDIPLAPPEYGTWRSSITPSTYICNPTFAAPKAVSIRSETALPLAQQTPHLSNGTASPPLTDKSTSPPVGTVANATMATLGPHHAQHQQQPQPVNINIAIHDGRTFANDYAAVNSASEPTKPGHVVVAPFPAYANRNTSRSNSPPQTAPVFFPPPPNAISKETQLSYGNFSRASTPAPSVNEAKTKGPRQHRKMKKLMANVTLCGNKKGGTKDGKKKKRSRWCLGCCCCLLILVLLAILIPVIVVFTKKHNNSSTNPVSGSPDAGDDTPTQWLNNTGYPPMKTGLLTIAQPEAVEEESGCVGPTTMWSCALPKEQQKDIEPNKPDQPNFRIEITFQNGTAADLSKPTRRAANPVSAGAFIRSLLGRATPAPSPAVPSVDDMKFLGKTTDRNSAPFEGESTPFFMSFQDPAAPSSSRLAKRANDPTDPTNITNVIPPPSLNPDGTAADANLLPFPSAQPLRLFNRDKPDEHYGFYTYFDRSIFLKSINTSLADRGGNPADTNGGSTRDAATFRCTFTQTRFLVQIWTRSQASKPLLSPPQTTSKDAFQRPGTFPYPVTFTVDRHGGDVAKKNLFCYKMEDDGTIVDNSGNKDFRFEDRGFGGNLVNGTQGRPNAQNPIDGGTGGCTCKWQNWVD